MNPKIQTIVESTGMSYSVDDCLSKGWINSQSGCSIIYKNRYNSTYNRMHQRSVLVFKRVSKTI